MPLSLAETQLHSALGDYLAMVSQGGTGSAHPAWTEKLKLSMQNLEALETKLSPQLDKRLRHFLESKSYRKAHDYLSALSSSGLANSPASRQTCSQ